MAAMAQNTTINFIDLAGRVNSAPLSTESEKPGTVSVKLGDLEAFALDQTGYCYALTSQSRDVKDAGGLNIGALEMSLNHQQLWIGFRSPLQGRRAIIASVENPMTIFESGESPRITVSLQTLVLERPCGRCALIRPTPATGKTPWTTPTWHFASR